MARKKKQRSLWDKALIVIFPKYTEIQPFVLFFSFILLLFYSSRFREIVLSIVTPGSLFNIEENMGRFGLALLLVVVPIFLMYYILSKKKMDTDGKMLIGFYFYMTFGILCLASLAEQTSELKLSGSTLQTLNILFSRVILGVSVVRLSVQFVLIRLDLADKRLEESMSDVQYRPVHFIIAAAVSLAIMHWLSFTYSSILALAFLTCSYTLFALWVIDKLMRLGYVAIPPIRRLHR